MTKKNNTFVFLLFLLNLMLLVLGNNIQNDYNVQDSIQFDKYCVMTHCDPQMIINWTCKLCSKTPALSDITHIDNKLTNVVAYTGYHQSRNAIIMIFRGTEDIKNWLEDFSFQLINYLRCSNCKIHQGFYLSYLSIAAQLQSNIEKMIKKYPQASIISVGSSLGASLASIAALQIQILFGKVSELHVFGCPRTGNSDFAGFLNKKIEKVRRIIHNKDIVPHVPLVSQNYYHPYQEILFSENLQQYKMCNLSGQDPTCSNSYYPNYSIEDHVTYFIPLVISQICK